MGLNQPTHEVDFDEVKRLSVQDFLEQQLGVHAKKMGGVMRMTSCPCCGDSKSGNPRLRIAKDDRSWKCFRSGQGGTILDAAMLLFGCSVMDAAKQLLGVRSDLKASLPKVDPAIKEAADRERKAMMRRVFGAIQKACADFQDEAVPLNYLVKERKIPIEVVREAQRRGMVGFLPSDPGKASAVLEEAVGKDLLQASGLWKPDKRLPGVSYRPLVFFLPGVASAEFRTCTPVKEGQLKSIRYGMMEYPYWWQGSDAQCMVVEGMIDLLSLVALGFKGHVMGLTGCNTFFPDWFDRAAKAHGIKRFAIGLDNDSEDENNPGQTWAAKIQEVITEQGHPSFIRAPEKGDINDILKARS